MIGAKVVMTMTSLSDCQYLRCLCLSPLVCWLKMGQAANLLYPRWKINLSLDLMTSSVAPGWRLTAKFNTHIFCSWGSIEKATRGRRTSSSFQELNKCLGTIRVWSLCMFYDVRIFFLLKNSTNSLVVFPLTLSSHSYLSQDLEQNATRGIKTFQA